MRHLFPLFILLFLVSCSKDVKELKQVSPGLAWTSEFDYGNYISQDAQSIVTTADNGFVLIKNDTLRKFDGDGNYEFNTNLVVEKIIKTNSGFLIYDGQSSKIKALNNDFSVDWELPFTDEVHYLLATGDGYVMTHSIASNVGIIKLTLNGQVEWQKTFENSSDRHLNSIQLTTDGYIATGYVQVPIENKENIWIVKLNNSGEIIWEKSHDNSEMSNATGVNIYQLDNGGFLALTLKNGSSASDFYGTSLIMIFDNEGEIVSENQFNNSNFKAITRTNDGNFLAVGSADRSSFGFPYGYNSDRVIAAKINQEGGRVWQLETSLIEYGNIGHAATQSTDNGYLIVADASTYDAYSMVFKINPEY